MHILSYKKSILETPINIAQIELQNECERLFSCKTIKDSNDLLDIYANFFLKVILNHHKETVTTQSKAEAKIIIQMMLTKVLHVKGIITGVSHMLENGLKLNKIIDPTVVASIVRNVYEMTGLFNLIFRSTKSNEERELLYLLWVTSGLSYRQRFRGNITTNENRKKHEEERIQIANNIDKIKGSELFKGLDKKNQEKIITKLKVKDYLLRIEDKEVKFLHWHNLTEVMDIKNGILDDIYTYLSLNAHPSNVAVFQFADMFDRGKEAFPEITIFNLKIAFFLFSIFSADYIKLFPNVLKTFESLELKEQIVINFYNTTARNYEYSINDAYKIFS